LDPHFRGDGLFTEDEHIKGMQLIAKTLNTASGSPIVTTSDDFEMQVFEQLGEFKIMTDWCLFIRAQVEISVMPSYKVAQ
jgi:hypothetical protein